MQAVGRETTKSVAILLYITLYTSYLTLPSLRLAVFMKTSLSRHMQKVDDHCFNMNLLLHVLELVFLMRPKAREMTQHGGPPSWLEESDPAG